MNSDPHFLSNTIAVDGIDRNVLILIQDLSKYIHYT
jgi:hypothetical protein